MAMRGLLGAASRVLARRDYEVKDRFAPMRTYDNYLAMVREQGFRPGTIIDVGVAFGTPWLHDAFPEAHLVLVEPQQQFRGVIGDILERRSGEWFAVGLGEAPSRMTLNVATNEPGSSSVRAMSDEARASFAARGIQHTIAQEEIEIVRLDSLDTSDWPKPWLLKVDVEGFELEVLRGAGELLSHVDMIIAELSVVSSYEGEGASLHKSLAEIERLGFDLADIINMQARGRTGRIALIDGVFLPRGRKVLPD